MTLKIYHGSRIEDLAEKLAGELMADRAAKGPFEFLNPTFHVREQNPSGCWGFAHRSSLHSRFRRVGSFA